MHPKENEAYMKATAEAEAEEESDAKKCKSLQTTINFPVFTSVRDNFLNACAKWVVDDFQPFNVGESKSFKAMIKALNPKLNPPDDKFVAMVTDTASNMTKLGRLAEEKFPNTVPHYCADHNLQLTTQKAYSGDIAMRLDGIANGAKKESSKSDYWFPRYYFATKPPPWLQRLLNNNISS